MAHLNAGVLATVQQGGARFLTAQQRSLAAAHRLAAKHPPTELVLRPEDNPTDLIKRGVPDLPTDARFCYKGRTLWTRSRMAQTEEACKVTLFRSLFAAFKDVYFSHVTGMVTVHAAPFLAAHVAAAVWNLAALPLRVHHFTCNPRKAVMMGNFTLTGSLIVM